MDIQSRIDWLSLEYKINTSRVYGERKSPEKSNKDSVWNALSEKGWHPSYCLKIGSRSFGSN